MKENKRKNIGNAALLLCALIWGSSFVAQSVGMEHVGAFTFQGVRSLLGSFVLIIFITITDKLAAKKKKDERTEKQKISDRKQLIIGGICCGIVLTVASVFQNYGMIYTSVGNAGFITSMYMILVPIFSVVLRKKVPIKIWLCVVIAAAGLYFISISGKMNLSKGDALVAICAVFFAIHIMVVDHFAPGISGVKLSCMQFFVSGIICMLPMIIVERPTLLIITDAIVPILYSGIMACGVAYTLQIVGQQYANPAIATLLMSLESIFSMIGGMILLSQYPSGRESFGCILVFIGVVVSQIDIKIMFRKN